jgi:hypothetical protein
MVEAVVFTETLIAMKWHSFLSLEWGKFINTTVRMANLACSVSCLGWLDLKYWRNKNSETSASSWFLGVFREHRPVWVGHITHCILSAYQDKLAIPWNIPEWLRLPLENILHVLHTHKIPDGCNLMCQIESSFGVKMIIRRNSAKYVC